ncbi:hypothetical protein EVAR_6497_1 [Eumeta japonica]|uniref:Uncharacterized protein n=1 Tax=Eumeta variegata TaxID=151549 RepID=A0A4C1ST96_EUMVA|nr:hypothetical protein EVAR_6497_1 [Eumeta japonica]
MIADARTTGPPSVFQGPHATGAHSRTVNDQICDFRDLGCGWESLMKSVTLGNVTMSRTRERPAECASLHSTMIGLPRAQH